MYPIIEVPIDAAERTEQLGTKFKFWHIDSNGYWSLFKQGRPGTGENWAEKIAAEVAQLLGIPHVDYELAVWRDLQGVVCRSCVPHGGRLVLGNELLALVVQGYGQQTLGNYARDDHTVRRVVSYFRATSDVVGAPFAWVLPDHVVDAFGVFVSYLMFDALIANQDRHDENWAVIRFEDGNSYLAPSFDHGSSLGRNETDAKRAVRLTTKDMGQHIEKYVKDARSALYSGVLGSKKSMLTIDAFQAVARYSPKAAKVWVEKLGDLEMRRIHAAIDGVPSSWMSDVAKEFTLKLIDLNRSRILALEV